MCMHKGQNSKAGAPVTRPVGVLDKQKPQKAGSITAAPYGGALDPGTVMYHRHETQVTQLTGRCGPAKANTAAMQQCE